MLQEEQEALGVQVLLEVLGLLVELEPLVAQEQQEKLVLLVIQV